MRVCVCVSAAAYLSIRCLLSFLVQPSAYYLSVIDVLFKCAPGSETSCREVIHMS